eukprot:10743738-Alexandrium_andersonii.AAC.1
MAMSAARAIRAVLLFSFLSCGSAYVARHAPAGQGISKMSMRNPPSSASAAERRRVTSGRSRSDTPSGAAQAIAATTAAAAAAAAAS